MALFCFVLFCTSLVGEPGLVSSTPGFPCTRPRWPLWGSCGSRNHFLKNKRKFKGFSFVLPASLLGLESPESGVPGPLLTVLERQEWTPGQVGAQDPLPNLQFPLLNYGTSARDGARGCEGPGGRN